MAEIDHKTSRTTVRSKNKTEKRRLNKRVVEAIEPPPEQKGRPLQRWVYDESVPHLALCIWSSGTRIWYWAGRFESSSLKYKLGTFPDMTPDVARKAATKVSAEVAAGIDPRDARKTHREDMTLEKLFAWFLENHARPHKKASSVDEDERLFRRYLEPWKNKKVSAIKRSDVRSLHAKIGRDNGPYAANRMLSLLGTMFSKAIDADDVAFAGGNPAKGVKRFAEKERDRFLQADELEAFFEALEEQPPAMRDYFKLALLTGARRGNVQAMRWEEVNLERAEWRVPDTKGGDPQRIYLSIAAVEILKDREEAATSEYVFPSRKGSKRPHITYQYAAWKRICKKAGLKDIRPHDLRRSLGSWQAATGSSLPIIGKTLGHRNQSTTAIYARMNLDPVKASVEAATAAMMAVVIGDTEA